MSKKKPKQPWKIWSAYKGGRELPPSIKDGYDKKIRRAKQLYVLKVFLVLQPTTTNEIADNTGFTAEYINDTMYRLMNLGVVRKTKGSNGRYGCEWELNI